ncbi:MAG TPA: glycosyltransferase family 87 protein [Leptospiraceae bacterium]|nr:glycosyltransferase family 87 protein [Leptospiraceae bacterium]
MQSRKFFSLYGFLCLLFLGIQLFNLIEQDTVIYADFKSFYNASKIVFNEKKSIYEMNDLRSVDEDYFPNTPNPSKIFSERLGDSMGIDSRILTPDFVYPFLYPPIFAYLFYPLTWLPIDKAYILWELLSLSLYLGLFFLILKSSSFSKDNVALSASLLLSYSWIALDNLTLGQVNILLTFILFLSLNSDEKKSILAGFLLALVTAIKMSPAILILYFILNKRYKIVVSFIGSLLGLLLFTLILGGYRHWINFISILPSFGQGDKIILGVIQADSSINLSIKGFAYRITPYASAYSEIIFLALIAVWIIYMIFIYISEKEDVKKEKLLIRLHFCMLFFSPMTWYAHLIYLFPAYWFLLNNYHIHTESQFRKWASYIILLLPLLPFFQWTESFVLAYPMQWQPAAWINSVHFMILMISFYSISLWQLKDKKRTV